MHTSSSPCAWSPGSTHAECMHEGQDTARGMQVDAKKLRRALAKQLFQRIVAASELVLVHIDSLAVVVRIIEVHNMDEEARQEAVSYHCYRGLVTPDTVMSLVEEGEGFTVS